MRTIKEKKDYEELAKEKGFVWIGETLPPTTATMTTWQCSKSHKFEMRYQDVKRGRPCPKCGGMARLTEDDYRTLAKKKGYEWIGEMKPENKYLVTKWKKDGVVIELSYQHMKHRKKPGERKLKGINR